MQVTQMATDHPMGHYKVMNRQETCMFIILYCNFMMT